MVFFRGTSLDPVPPVASENVGVRSFHVHEGEALDEKLVAKWVRQPSELPGDACF